MTTKPRRLGRGAPLLAAVLAVAVAAPVNAQPPSTAPSDPQSTTIGPVVTPDRSNITPGEHVVATIDGFTVALVTISVCGNNATRGSTDCNMTASEGVKLNGDGSATLADLPIAEPPSPCPCVIRVSSLTFDEVAVAPITLVGHPVAPVVGGPNATDPLVAVSVEARAAPHGLLDAVRSSLGGPSTFEVTVTVKNLTNEVLRRVAVSASVGHGANDSVTTIALAAPGEIGAGQTRQQVVTVTVPAPTLRSLTWRVAASGAGPSVIVTDTTHRLPVLLLFLVAILLADLGFLVVRTWRRRRAERGDSTDTPLDDESEPIEVTFRELVKTPR